MKSGIDKLLLTVTKLMVVLWVICIFIFVANIALSQQKEFGNSRLYNIILNGSLLIGILAFGLAFVAFMTSNLFEKKILELNPRSLRSWLSTFFKLGLILAFLPLFIIYRIIDPLANIKQIFQYGLHRYFTEGRMFNLRLVENLVSVGIIGITLLPLWVAGYYVSVMLAVNIPGYSKQIKNNQLVPSFVEQRVPKISAEEVFESTNNERVKSGLKPLKRNSKLDGAALERAKVIIEYNEWAHEATKSGLPYTEAIKKAHYWNTEYGENLASGQYTSEEVVSQWMTSETHKANILNPKYQEVGIATYSGQLNGSNTVVTVQLFGGYRPPDYKADYLKGWENALISLANVKPSWENIKNFPSTYQANKKDADRLLEIMNLRIYRMEKIVARIKANQWFTAEEDRWAYEDKKLYEEQEVLAKRLDSQTWK